MTYPEQVEESDQGARVAKVIAFPQEARPSVEVEEVPAASTGAPAPDAELEPVDVVDGEIVEEGDDGRGVARMYWRRTTAVAKRPDRILMEVLKHEIVYGSIGTARSMGRAWRWMTAAELEAHLATNPKMVLDTRRTRKKVAFAASAGIGTAGTAAWLLLTPAAPLLALVLVLAVAGAVERTQRAATAKELGIGVNGNREGIGTEPSGRDLREALSQVKGLGTAEEIRALGPVTRDESDTAWTAIVQMPAGVTFRKLLAKKEEIAGVFDVAVSQLRITPLKASEARARIWCSDEDPLTGPPIMSPLINRETPFNVWTEKVFLGTSTQRTPVEVGLPNKAGMLTGGESGSGKSVADDQILCSVALDPYAQLWLVDAKMVELEAYRSIATRYLGEPDREAFKELVEDLTWEKDRRLRDMARAGVVRITGDNWQRFDAPFIFFHVDEIQMFIVGEKKREVSEPLGKFLSQCRAVGMFGSLATQYPKDQVVPTFLRENLTMRLGMRCSGSTASNVILGEGMAGKGFNAGAFTEDQKGAAYLKGEKGDPVQLRTGYLEKPDVGEPGEHHVRDILAVAQRLRAQAGTLPTGDDRPAARLLDAMIAIIEASGQRNAHTTEHLLPGLALRLPETRDWGPEELAEALPNGVRTGGKNVRAFSESDGRDMSRPGYRLDDLKTARKRL